MEPSTTKEAWKRWRGWRGSDPCPACSSSSAAQPQSIRREVRAAHFVEHPAGGDGEGGRWEVDAVNLGTGEEDKYAARFLVVSTGEFDEKVIPAMPDLDTFPGEVIHSSEYCSAKGLQGKALLVVGCGNSGTEIALDLAKVGAAASIVHVPR